MLKQTVIHHTALAKSGGATRVAELLHEGLRIAGYDSVHSFEASEKPGDPLISPQQAASNISPNAIVHLHSSADPAKFINALPRDINIVITLHDSQMITGGCSYPLNCTHFEQQCRNPCPRNFPDSETVRSNNISALLESRARIISPSRWLARQARKADQRIKVKIIPNGIPWPETLGDRKQARTMLGLHPAAKVVLFLAHGGQKAAYKSGPEWIKYWELIKAEVPEAIAFAVGGNSNSQEGNFITVPYINRETLRRFMLAADVFAYPTLADNHPLVILEAMSCGLTTVSYAVGGVVEQITPDVNGILVPPFEKNTFTQQVVNLLKNHRIAREMGEQGFHKGKKIFNSNRMINDHIKLYDNLAKF